MVRGHDRGQGVVFTITDGEIDVVRVSPIFDRATGRVDPEHVLVYADDPRDYGRERRLNVQTEVFQRREDAEVALERRLRVSLARFGTFSGGMLLREGLAGEQVHHLQSLDATDVLIRALQLYAANLPDANGPAMQMLGIGALSLRDVEHFAAKVRDDSAARVRAELADDGTRPDRDLDEPNDPDAEESE